MGKIVKSMISYSSSFEDVILQRALQHVPHGCYVDVGASIPIRDSNTAAFYRKGWRGICLEPIKELNVLWAEERPEDILINAAAGAVPGETDFYFFSKTSQISTCSTEMMQGWERCNQPPDERRTVPVITLNQVMEQFLNERTIHVLSIDVEGYEKQVLQGFDLQQYHPWVIVVEATLPGTHTPSYQDWEGGILEAGYTAVYKDGINRFYLSNTRSELLEHFVSPPNVWDGFITYKQEFAETQVNNLEKVNEALMSESTVLRQMIAGDINVPANFWSCAQHASDIDIKRQLASLEEENKILNDQIKALQQSYALKNFISK